MPTVHHLANAIRALSMDAVQRANSGHPGMPMGMADIAEVLWRKHLRHNPADPHWLNRDRFVLSNGHGSMLLYSLLHLTGYDLSIEDLQSFRQLDSKTPGHPEYGYTPGVETTTGPLGQGLANAVGFALAEKQLAHSFNKPDIKLIDHFTYVFVGDGCLMEGLSHEVCSLAATWQLGKLIVFWDDNGISIDGEVADWFTDDTAARFRAYGWQVIDAVDGHDSEQIEQAIQAAKSEALRPTLICCKTVIGFGSPNKAGRSNSHGSPLGDEEIALAKKRLNWPYKPFEIPEEVYTAWSATMRGQQWQNEWDDLFEAYQRQYPKEADILKRRLADELPHDWEPLIEKGIKAAMAQPVMATRKASQFAIEYFAEHLPEMIGGSADLTGSNNTNWKGCIPITRQNEFGNYIYYGVREFGMCAIMNGLALYGGFVPFGGTFLVFSDYARNAIRMAALMRKKAIYVLTHDSIGLGEDGPTHQPVEHLASLRLIPNLDVWRPCDVVETFVAWQTALERADGPSVLALSRQDLPNLERTPVQVNNICRGGYVLKEIKKAHITLLATGSEVMLAVEAAEQLRQEGVYARVVSMPCVELFLYEEADYHEEVLPFHLPTLVIEAGCGDLWASIIPAKGAIISLDQFGESAPANELFEHFGFTVEHVVEAAKELIENS